MSTIACKDCGQQISKRAKKCPSCGRPQTSRSGCLISGVGAVVLFIVMVWWLSSGMQQQANTTMTGIKDKVASDAVEQYRIAAAQGDKIQICVQAGMVAATYLQAQDKANYDQWKTTEASDCARAGIPH